MAKDMSPEDVKRMMALLNARGAGGAAAGGAPEQKEHRFWNTQPVPQLDEQPEEHGAIETKVVGDVRPKPYALPKEFEWTDCKMDDPAQLEEVYQLLYQNYVEDDDNMFRFDYSKEFLQWALLPPGYLPQLHVGVRVAKSKKLVAFITGIPARVRVYDNSIKMVEINFLCVHKKLRSKRLAPVLIKEITRRVNLTDVWQAVYTAGVVLPKPVGRNRYYHRSLNPKKLIDVQFSRLARNMTMARTIKLYRVPDKFVTPGVRPMEARDAEACLALLTEYFKTTKLHQEFSLDEFQHAMLPREGVVYSYVVEDPATKKVTDFFSFYSLPSSIIGHPRHKTLNAAYSFYNVSTKTPWKALMLEALIAAKNNNFDVFNALDVMENGTFFKELKFGVGDGNLQYYLYNWRCPEMKSSDVGLVLL